MLNKDFKIIYYSGGNWCYQRKVLHIKHLVNGQLSMKFLPFFFLKEKLVMVNKVHKSRLWENAESHGGPQIYI